MTKIIHALTDRVRDFSMLDVRHRIYSDLLRLSQPKAGAEESCRHLAATDPGRHRRTCQARAARLSRAK